MLTFLMAVVDRKWGETSGPYLRDNCRLSLSAANPPLHTLCANCDPEDGTSPIREALSQLDFPRVRSVLYLRYRATLGSNTRHLTSLGFAVFFTCDTEPLWVQTPDTHPKKVLPPSPRGTCCHLQLQFSVPQRSSAVGSRDVNRLSFCDQVALTWMS